MALFVTWRLPLTYFKNSSLDATCQGVTLQV